MLYYRIKNIFSPRTCVFCRGELPWWAKREYCDDCYFKLPFKEEKRCLICQRQIDGAGDIKVCNICSSRNMRFDVCYAPFNYDGNIESAIKRFKFVSDKRVGRILSEFMCREIEGVNLQCDYIVYPPVNRLTYAERGYNQAEILSRRISKETGIPVLKDALYKIKDNEKQSNQTFANRFKNVQGVFSVREKYAEKIRRKSILLVDDVLTTGATASECSKVLKQCGAVQVKVVTCATTY